MFGHELVPFKNLPSAKTWVQPHYTVVKGEKQEKSCSVHQASTT
jgi:hypothetical protein